MRSFKLFALFATLLATSRAIPIQREDFDLVARDYEETSLEARDLYDSQASFHVRDLGSDDDELFAREDLELLDARDLYSDDFLEARSDEDVYAELFARNRGNAAIKAQGARQDAKVKQANANKRTHDRAASASNAAIPKPKLNTAPGQTPEQKKDARTAYDAATASRAKAANKAGAQAVTQAVKDKKAARTEKWANAKGVAGVKTGAKPNNPAGSRATRIATQQANRATTKGEMRAAGQRMQNTVNIPNRDAQFTVSNAKTPTDTRTKVITGKDARKAVFAANVNQPRPVGPQQMPKTFNNDPYSPTHPIAGLRNQPTIPGLPAGQGREYPVLSGSKSGWTGDSPVGTARVITQNGAGGSPDTFHGVIAHDKTKGGSNHDHYLAPQSREFVEDFDDEWL